MDQNFQLLGIANEDHWVIKILDQLIRSHETYYYIEVFHDSELEREWSVEERVVTYKNGPELLTAFRTWYTQFRNQCPPNIFNSILVVNQEVVPYEAGSVNGPMSSKLLESIEDLVADGYFNFQLGFLDKSSSDRRSSYLYFIELVHDSWQPALLDKNLYFPSAIVTFRNKIENYGSNYYSDSGRSILTVFKSDKFRELLDKCISKTHFALIIDLGLPFINSEFGVCVVNGRKGILHKIKILNNQIEYI